ncbi:MAG: ribbon-helix-helix protein, CopG family [Candidatus Omnitrophota bacterium]
MVHINITIPEEMKARLDAASHREKLGRSTIIQRAVDFYIDEKERCEREILLKEGYAQMNGEAQHLMKDFEFSDTEASGHAD